MLQSLSDAIEISSSTNVVVVCSGLEVILWSRPRGRYWTKDLGAGPESRRTGQKPRAGRRAARGGLLLVEGIDEQHAQVDRPVTSLREVGVRWVPRVEAGGGVVRREEDQGAQEREQLGAVPVAQLRVVVARS